MPVGKRNKVCTSSCLSSSRLTVSPAPPSKRTLSGTTIAARAVLLQDGEDVLEEIELIVAGARPKIVGMHDERLFLFVAGFVHDRDAAFLSEWRIGQDHFVFARVCLRALIGKD